MKPTVSVVMTTYNAKERLRFALASLAAQTYPKDRFEIVVVDDASTDGTERWMKKQSWKMNVRYIRNEVNRGRSGARNAALQAATGEIILFVDCDMIQKRNFIARHVKYHKSSDNLVVCGSFWNPVFTHVYRGANREMNRNIVRIVRKYPMLKEKFNSAHKRLEGKVRYARLISYNDIPAIGVSRWRNRRSWLEKYFASKIKEQGSDFHFPWIYFVVMNVSVRKVHLDRTGGFDEDLIGYGGEDTDLGYRLWKHGLHFKIDPKLKNFHQEHPRTVNKQEAERWNNIVYLTRKHEAVDLTLHLCVPAGDDVAKSRFLNSRDRLRQSGKISASYANQIDRLVWATAQAVYPFFHEQVDRQTPLDEVSFHSETERLRREGTSSEFVAYVDQLTALINRYS